MDRAIIIERSSALDKAYKNRWRAFVSSQQQHTNLDNFWWGFRKILREEFGAKTWQVESGANGVDFLISFPSDVEMVAFVLQWG